MASSATAPPSSNGASGNASALPSNPAIASGRPQIRANPSSKSIDGNRRQSASPADGSQSKRNTSQKAWTQGTNPITQRASNLNQQNGAAAQPKGIGAMKGLANVSKETNTPDIHANDRLLFLLGNLKGLSATITTKHGDSFSGIFSGALLEPGEMTYVLRMVKRIKSAGEEQVNGSVDAGNEFVGVGPDHTMTFEIKDVVEFAVGNVGLNDPVSKTQNGLLTQFKTDSDISGNLAARERTLQRWEGTADDNVSLSLEGPDSAGWDQFETNERLYGVKSNYDENIYTTTIDRSNPLYKQRAAMAEKLARDIEGGNTTNAHMAEERGITTEDDAGIDEEDKYSGVRRDQDTSGSQLGQSNKYTPPARRPPSGQVAASAAPIDPAIISSQIARPDLSATKSTQQKVPPSPAHQQYVSSAVSDTNDAPPSVLAPETSSQLPTANIPASKTVPSIRGLAEAEQKPRGTGVSIDPSASASPNRNASGHENATANVETEVRDAFKQFANVEKMRVQERKRNQAKHDKDIKLNDLMKFSKNFKLMTPVPKDLVPILAKDKIKQEEIMEKAQRNALEANSTSISATGKPAATLIEQRAQRPLAVTRAEGNTNATPSAADRQNFPRGRQGYFPQVPHNSQPARGDRPNQAQIIPVMSPRSGPGLSTRLATLQQHHKSGAPLPSVPSPVPIKEVRQPPTGPAIRTADVAGPQRPSAAPTPTPSSATSSKFNVKALEFKPNPAAVSFTPTGDASTASSPRSNANILSASRVPSPSAFFGSKKPLPISERPFIRDAFNPVKRARLEAIADKSAQGYAFNGGIKPAYKTTPTWDVSEENKNKSYTEMFDKVSFSTQAISPPHPPHVNPQVPHQHQLPFHLQHGGHGLPQVHAPNQISHQLHPQQIHNPPIAHHFDDHRMHLSASQHSVHPSPRLQHINMAYHQSPMSQNAQLAYGQPMPQYGIAPGGPQLAHMRQYQGGPQFINPQAAHMGAPMMIHQGSAGPFMGVPQGMGIPFNPQLAGYSPNQGHAYPQHIGHAPPPPGSSGYSSPGRGAPMMMHQGSQQGQPPQQMIFMTPGQHGQAMYAPQQPSQMTPLRAAYPQTQQQPYFSSSPHQPHHYPSQQHRGPSSNYGQPPLPPHHVSSHQPLPPTAPAAHVAEAAEEGK
ncbi:MAG: hypothetical protein M1827_005354 [Pycnora praestabilis]|nr:MAG: hypothetical protein M1827_005354 [Pycnora praestabilis]